MGVKIKRKKKKKNKKESGCQLAVSKIHPDSRGILTNGCMEIDKAEP